MITKYDNYTDAELIRMVDNSPNSTELEIALAERLDMRNRDLEEMQRETRQAKEATPRPDSDA